MEDYFQWLNNSPRYGMVQTPVHHSRWNQQSPFPKSTKPSNSPRYGMGWNQSPTKPSKVVQIPVHFVGTEKRKSIAALKIQKVFRGFLIRKNVKKIVGIKREVDEIEKKISQKEMIDLIRRDSKERLKVNEMLMALLFRLDSIRGIDSGVRDCRKSVTKKAIMLQERLDSIVAGDETLEMVVEEENKDQVVEMADCVDEQTIENADFSENCEATLDNVVDQKIEFDGPVEAVQAEHNSGDYDDAAELQGSVELNQKIEFDGPVEAVQAEHNSGDYDAAELQGSVELNQDGGDPMIESTERSQVAIAEHKDVDSETRVGNVGSEFEEDAKEGNLMELVEEGKEEEAEEKEEEGEAAMEIQQPELIQVDQVEDTLSVENRQKRGGGDDSKDLMVRMIEGNEKLTGLVAELCERNETQTRLINSLSQRVDNLEKALKNERLRRKKKRTDATSTKATKCGRKS